LNSIDIALWMFRYFSWKNADSYNDFSLLWMCQISICQMIAKKSRRWVMMMYVGVY